MAELRQQIAQMLVMGFAGTSIDEIHPVRKWINQEQIGAVILFDYDMQNRCQGKNLINKEQIQQLTEQLQQALPDHAKLPLFIAIDYEGGSIDRLKYVPDCPKTLTPSELAALDETEFQTHVGIMASTVKSLGFNLNFAPVVDLDLSKEQGIIGKLGRSFSVNPDEVASLAASFVSNFAEHKLICCYKHFPGHGSALGDTHEDFVDVTDSFQPSELQPYQKLAKRHDLPAMIMTAHVINRNLDPSGLPATLSKKMLTGLLREEFGFEGVIVSDDLQMHAIAKHYSLEKSLELTINAGADMLIFGNQLGQITAPEVIDQIEQLVLSGVISSARIAESYERILKLKRFLGTSH
ncbi:glycoside hydrolase family 3 protein [Legionella jordanis]|uniref:glycoside hydrolase family 3 protein n=1 Tax=Legionella jordanis TaxID=456 RepID=UPI000EFE72B2|nr:glycoside hydrolase family 3 N-terminal domain-containing protein [Legionella jordanis]RMX21021.1 glycoside hydrolase family 3 protein [Legionella jordanis]